MIKDFRNKYENLLLLDSGDSISRELNVPDLRAASSIEGFRMMKYDAVNVADGELGFGIEFLTKNVQKTGASLLSANLTTKNDNHSVGQEFLIKKMGGLKVGIIGLVSPDCFDKQKPIEEGLVIKDPEETLKRVLSQIRGKANVIVLLSHLGLEATRALVQKVDGIHVAIVGHGLLQTITTPELAGKTIIVQSGYKGRYLGTLSLVVDKNGTISNYQGSSIELSKAIPDDPEVGALIEEFKQDKKSLDKAASEKAQQVLIQQHKDELKMTPEEFIEKMKKQNDEKK